MDYKRGRLRVVLDLSVDIIVSKVRASIVWKSAALFDKKDRQKILAVVLIQILLSFLDLIGVALVGLLGALGVAGIQSRRPEGAVQNILSQLGIANLDFQQQALVLGILSTAILIARTAFSVIFTRRILFFLSRRAAAISEQTVRALFEQQLSVIQKRSSQDIVFSLTNGISALTIGVIGTAVSIVADGALLFVIGVGLLIIDPMMAIGTALLFGFAAFVLHRLMHKRALSLGIQQAEISVESNQILLESLSAYRDMYVRNSLDQNVNRFSNKRFELSNNIAESTFMPFVSKYVIETMVLVGALTLSAVQFVLQDAEHAIATLAVFMAAGTRLAPAILRIQQSNIAMKSASGNAQRSLGLIDELNLHNNASKNTKNTFTIDHSDFHAEIEVVEVSARYPGADDNVLNNINLRIRAGEAIAIVGSSGSGKSTLIDVILGVLEPITGSVSISGVIPEMAISKWPGAIGYVPQDVYIKDGSIAENISLGFEIEDVPKLAISRAIDKAQLSDLVAKNSQGVHALVGENGSMLSGGQKQRLGIARAIVTNPGLLILDEATSALDGKTESEITEAISSLKGTCTIILVAHRLSSLRSVDKVVYLENGNIAAIGSFEEVRALVPDFDTQAISMGL